MSRTSKFSKPFRRCALTLLGTAAGIVLLFTAFNTWVNPLWVTPSPWTDESFAAYRPIYRHQRTAKAGLVRSAQWQAAFFGSSRIDIALDPANPHWGNTRAVNLAVSAGTLPETAAILRYTLAREHLETAIAGIDIGDLMSSHSPYQTTGFMESPFNPKGDRFERELRYLSGISTFQTAIQTLINRHRQALPEYTPQGHRLRHHEPPNVRQTILRDSIPHALRTVRRRKHALEPNAWKISLLQQILDDSKAARTRLVLLIPPSHASYIGLYHLENDPDPCFTRDRGIMARLVAQSNADHPEAPAATIWDFNDFHELNCEAIPADKSRMKYWVDGTHARKSLGDVMLARIMAWPVDDPAGADYGFELNAANLDQRTATLRQGYQDFRTRHPELWQWMCDGAKTYQTTDDSAGEAKDEAAPAF